MSPRLVDQQYELVRLDQVRPHPDNARIGDLEVIADSVEVNGFYGACLVQRSTGYILAGNHRYLAAQQKGLTEIPVLWADVDLDQARRIMVADNRTADRATYDDSKLLALLEGLALTPERLAGTGFGDSDLAALVPKRELLREPDEIPEPPAHPVTRAGDLWLLGRHRLLCGDASEQADVARVLGEAQPYLMVTDPPYGVQLDPTWRDGVYNKLGPGALPYMTEGHANRRISHDTIADWSNAYELVPSLRVVYVWHGALHAHSVAEGLERLGFSLVAQVIWDKGHFVIGRGMYHWGHEPCWVGRRGEKVPFLRPHDQSTVWRAASPKMIMGGSQEEKFDHPAQKPVAVIEPPILNHVPAGGLVYDPFMGSGTTLVAAEVHGRTALGTEIEPKFCDVVCKRYQQLTGEQPVLEASGQRHDFEAP